MVLRRGAQDLAHYGKHRVPFDRDDYVSHQTNHGDFNAGKLVSSSDPRGGGSVPKARDTVYRRRKAFMLARVCFGIMGRSSDERFGFRDSIDFTCSIHFHGTDISKAPSVSIKIRTVRG